MGEGGGVGWGWGGGVGVVFFFNDTATTEIYTLSLHDALPISLSSEQVKRGSLQKGLLTGMPEQNTMLWLSLMTTEKKQVRK